MWNQVGRKEINDWSGEDRSVVAQMVAARLWQGEGLPTPCSPAAITLTNEAENHPKISTNL